MCPLYVIDPRIYDPATQIRKDYLVGGLVDLDRQLIERGGRLRVEVGDPIEVVPRVAAEVGASSVHINSEVTPFGRRRDRRVGEKVDLVAHSGVYIQPYGAVRTLQGDPYRIFTPYYRSWIQHPPPAAWPIPDMNLDDHPGSGIPHVAPAMEVGETAALARLEAFGDRADDYLAERDRPDLDTTARISIDLKYGWLSPAHAMRHVGSGSPGRTAWIRQLAWRDFFGQALVASPGLATRSQREEMRKFPWRDDPEGLEAWKSGLTGYPIVDAGMRQLATEGWMHNRVRMITASFLVKHLLIDWRHGEAHFRRHLLDADVAQNAGNWQWVAGTGVDSSPFFRVFNPTVQSRKFDPEGEYLRRWVPELSQVDDRTVHLPGQAGGNLLTDYPGPIVDHEFARNRALTVYAGL